MNLRIVLIAALCMQFSCAEDIKHADVPGEYTVGYQGDTAKLYLFKDYTFTQYISPKDNAKIENSGTWHIYQEDPSTIRVVLNNFRSLPSYRSDDRLAEWSTVIEKSWLGSYQLCFDWDVGYCYEKNS